MLHGLADGCAFEIFKYGAIGYLLMNISVDACNGLNSSEIDFVGVILLSVAEHHQATLHVRDDRRTLKTVITMTTKRNQDV